YFGEFHARDVVCGDVFWCQCCAVTRVGVYPRLGRELAQFPVEYAFVGGLQHHQWLDTTVVCVGEVGIRPAGSDDSARRGSTYPQVEVRGPLRVAQMFTASHWSVDQHIWNPTLCECCRIAHGCLTIDGF